MAIFEPGIVFAELTDVGMRRTNNQDSLVCVPARSDVAYDARGHLFVVADGMGAHAAGELASRLATDNIAQQYIKSADHQPAVAALHDAIAAANTEIHNRGQTNPDFHNMGTTACAMVIDPAGISIGHVGDSRAYRLRDKVLHQLTFDHSLVWELEAGGQITAAGAHHIPKNVITRSLGPSADVAIDIEGPMRAVPGDHYLLCSDGLTGPVTDEEIAVLLDCLEPKTAARVLVDLANLRGGPDNISVIVVAVVERNASRGRVQLTSLSTRAVATAASIVLFLFAIAATVTAGIVIGLLAAVPAIVAAIVAATAGGAGPAVSSNARRSHWGGGKAPYRKYGVHPTRQMVDAFSDTVGQLLRAAEDRGWRLNTGTIKALQTKSDRAAAAGNYRTAIGHQAEAIIQTMQQLRNQNDKAAADTAVR